MNNNTIPINQNISQNIPQNIQNSGVDYSQQQFQNPYYMYLMPEAQILLQELNFYQIYPMPYLQNLQNASQQMNNSNNNNNNNDNKNNINNNINNIQLLYNLIYNNIFHQINPFQYGFPYLNQGNPQLNYIPNSIAPTANDTYFLNKKRNDNDVISYERNNEKANITSKPTDQVIQNKEKQVLKDTNNMDNNETKVKNKKGNTVKMKKSIQNENIQNGGNLKDIITTEISTNFSKENKETEKKKNKRKKRINEELLKDTFLEHIGETKKKLLNTIEEEPPSIKRNQNINNSNPKNKNKNNNRTSKARNIQKDNKSINLEEKTIDDNSESKDKDKDKNKKSKARNLRNQKKRQHKITIKNNNNILADLKKDENDQKSLTNPKLTKINFHGDNYEKTTSPTDFMKYNFDFQIEEQYKTKKLITDYDEQHIDMMKMKDNFYDNYNYNEQHLDEIEQKWSRKKFDGSNKELKKVINIIRDSFPGRKVDTNEEKCLNILKNNGYNIKDFLNSKL